jgi:hypothetical protein
MRTPNAVRPRLHGSSDRSLLDGRISTQAPHTRRPATGVFSGDLIGTQTETLVPDDDVLHCDAVSGDAWLAARDTRSEHRCYTVRDLALLETRQLPGCGARVIYSL